MYKQFNIKFRSTIICISFLCLCVWALDPDLVWWATGLSKLFEQNPGVQTWNIWELKLARIRIRVRSNSSYLRTTYMQVVCVWPIETWLNTCFLGVIVDFLYCGLVNAFEIYYTLFKHTTPKEEKTNTLSIRKFDLIWYQFWVQIHDVNF